MCEDFYINSMVRYVYTLADVQERITGHWKCYYIHNYLIQ
jgi:hypothetical protein